MNADYSRREFVKVCALAAASIGLAPTHGRAWAAALEAGKKPSIIWLHFQELSLIHISEPTRLGMIRD